jgi:hypothetical protein
MKNYQYFILIFRILNMVYQNFKDFFVIELCLNIEK